jgi:hypothetical protein
MDTFLYCCYKCCHKSFQICGNWWKDISTCTAIVFKHKIIISVHLEKGWKFLQPDQALSIKDHQMTRETIGLVSSTTSMKHTASSGKQETYCYPA